MSTLTANEIKEEISRAYLAAISAKAGIAMDIPRRDVHSGDVSLKGEFLIKPGERVISNIEVQLKSTSDNYEPTDNYIKYDLKIKNYNDLIATRAVPMILGLLIIPDFDNSVVWSREELILRSTMYWISLEGRKKVENKASVRINIPIEQTLNSDSLFALMEEYAREQFL